MPSGLLIFSADHAVDVMGGTRAMAQWAGVTEGAVSQWRQNGIPAAYHRRLAARLQQLGYIFDTVERVSLYIPILGKSNIERVDG